MTNQKDVEAARKYSKRSWEQKFMFSLLALETTTEKVSAIEKKAFLSGIAYARAKPIQPEVQASDEEKIQFETTWGRVKCHDESHVWFPRFFGDGIASKINRRKTYVTLTFEPLNVRAKEPSKEVLELRSYVTLLLMELNEALDADDYAEFIEDCNPHLKAFENRSSRDSKD